MRKKKNDSNKTSNTNNNNEELGEMRKSTVVEASTVIGEAVLHKCVLHGNVVFSSP